MTYLLVDMPFVLVTVAVTLLTLWRPDFARRMAGSAIAAAVLLALTAIFDNLMIAAGLFSYPPQHLTGLRIGLAPLEDFAYPLSAAFLVPALFVLLPARRTVSARSGS